MITFDSFKDGDPLPGGKVISLKGDFCVAVYRCRCGREQTARHEALTGRAGGLTEDQAKSLGWKCADSQWKCPFCSNGADEWPDAI